MITHDRMRPLILIVALATPATAAGASVEATVREAVAEQLGISRERVSPGARLVDLGADELDVVELVTAVETALGVELPDADAETLGNGTVAEAVRVFERASRVAAERPAPEPPATARPEPRRRSRRGGTATRERPDPRPAAPSPAGVPPATAPRPDATDDPGYREALAAYYAAMAEKNRADQATFAALRAYDEWALENRKRVIEWQQTAAMIVLAVVVLLVLTGVVFSGIQFSIAMRHARRGERAPATTLKASLGSIEVSSSVLGVVVLGISLLFFYLYLDRVFDLAVVPG